MKKVFGAQDATITRAKKKPTLFLSLSVLLALVLFVGLGVGPLKLNIALLLFLSWVVVAPLPEIKVIVGASIKQISFCLWKTVATMKSG